jgi:uncharacterized protein YndB with AHSA1/START domain
MNPEPIAQRDLVLIRRFHARRELVWRTFSEPELLEQWWGPENFTSTITRFDFRPEGEWHVTMRSPEGTERFIRYQYIEIREPERIVYRPLRPPDAILRPNLPPTYVATLTFEATDSGETVFTMRAEFGSVAERRTASTGGFAVGTGQAIDRLERLLATL